MLEIHRHSYCKHSKHAFVKLTEMNLNVLLWSIKGFNINWARTSKICSLCEAKSQPIFSKICNIRVKIEFPSATCFAVCTFHFKTYWQPFVDIIMIYWLGKPIRMQDYLENMKRVKLLKVQLTGCYIICTNSYKVSLYSLQETKPLTW